MSRLDWRNIQAPNFGGVTEAMRLQGDLFNAATQNLGKAVNQFDGAQTEMADQMLYRQMLQYKNPAEAQAAIASGAAYGGVDPRLVSAKALQNFGDNVGTLQNRDIKGFDLSKEQYTFGRTVQANDRAEAARILAQQAAGKPTIEARQEHILQSTQDPQTVDLAMKELANPIYQTGRYMPTPTTATGTLTNPADPEGTVPVTPATGASSALAAAAGTAAPTSSGSVPGHVADFVKNVTPHAEKVAAKLGVPVDAVIGQWGLETGWGKSVIPGTNNYGNIKDFSGGGVAAKDNATGTTDKYRRYDTPEAFADDFTKLVGGDKRYAKVAGTKDATGYFTGLKQGGYAEDPEYINKGVTAANLVAQARGTVAGDPARAVTTAASAAASANLPAAPRNFIEAQRNHAQLTNSLKLRKGVDGANQIDPDAFIAAAGEKGTTAEIANAYIKKAGLSEKDQGTLLNHMSRIQTMGLGYDGGKGLTDAQAALIAISKMEGGKEGLPGFFDGIGRWFNGSSPTANNTYFNPSAADETVKNIVAGGPLKLAAKRGVDDTVLKNMDGTLARVQAAEAKLLELQKQKGALRPEDYAAKEAALTRDHQANLADYHRVATGIYQSAKDSTYQGATENKPKPPAAGNTGGANNAAGIMAAYTEHPDESSIAQSGTTAGSAPTSSAWEAIKEWGNQNRTPQSVLDKQAADQADRQAQRADALDLVKELKGKLQKATTAVDRAILKQAIREQEQLASANR